MRRAFFSPPPFTFDDRRLIGEGSFGKVFFGTLTDSNKPICVKVTKDALDHSFEREFELLAKLIGKEAIIQTFGYSDTGSFRCIVLERADGALEHLLNLPRHTLGLPMQTVLDLVGDLAKAMTVLFEMKVAHRDIKPMNILYFVDKDSPRIGDRYKFKLCDFGGGRSVADIEYSFQTIGGTLHYMAPQMLTRYLRSHDKPSMNAEKTDLWSLGVTLHRCITGRLPFDPRPFSPHKLLRMLDERPSNRVVAFRMGKYDEKLHAAIHPRWFLDTMTVLIRLLFHQRNSENIALLMGELAKLRSRVVYNVRRNVFYINHPQLDEKHMWFMEEWKLRPAQVDVDDDARVCVMNEGTDIRFLGAGETGRFSSANFDKVNMTWKRQQDDKWLRQRKAAPLSEINDVPGDFLIVCERPLDRMRRAPPAVSSKELARQIEENFSTLTPEACAGIAHYDLLALQEYIENIHRVSYTIDIQRREALKKLKRSLERSQLRPNTELRDRALITFKTRSPEEFRLIDDIQEATMVVYNCIQILEDLDEKRASITRAEEIKKKRLELVAMAKYLATAQRNLQEGLVRSCKTMMSSLRRIIEFNELSDNLEAEIDGLPLPHDLIPGPVVHHVISKNDLRYETPPGNVPRVITSGLRRTASSNSNASNNNKSDDQPPSPEVKPPWIEKRLLKSAQKAERCRVS